RRLISASSIGHFDKLSTALDKLDCSLRQARSALALAARISGSSSSRPAELAEAGVTSRVTREPATLSPARAAPQDTCTPPTASILRRGTLADCSSAGVRDRWRGWISASSIGIDNLGGSSLSRPAEPAEAGR